MSFTKPKYGLSSILLVATLVGLVVAVSLQQRQSAAEFQNLNAAVKKLEQNQIYLLKLDEIKDELRTARTNYTSKHPVIYRLQGQIERIESRINENSN